MCYLKDMNYISVFINAIVVALMAMYVYQNERRMEEMAAKHNQTDGYYLRMLKRIESKLDDNTALLQQIFSGLPKDNSTSILMEVAHGKPAEQSSVYGALYSASRAVDGNVNTFMHTNIEKSPYWMVDFGKTYQVKRIEIFNINDGAKSTGERLHDLDITVGPSHNKMQLCAHYVGPAQVGSHLLFECFHENARYVKLMIKGTECLHVAEVKIYAVDDRSS
ncbi:uncharacterized protein LOC127706222 [Mytilus californianus]|uniref:uncharacterized protein LOC127706222 n=1 Tax=Mytilus californianus TaxID=6549 RepID=UPI0022466C7C|nr:uncharacterized protein LOC127706222 [Mytilus californianus]